MFMAVSSASAADDGISPSLADVAWMEGHWVMESGAGRAEEIWMAPADGSMVGSFRWFNPGKMHVLEFLVIEETDAGVAFRFKHFDKDYRAWETDAPNSYRLAGVEDRKAEFVNLNWNGKVPQRITYTSPSPDRLRFRGESPDAEDAEPLVLEFVRAR
jgi:hypothetical protein